MTDLLRRAWDALDSFKQAYPENWSEEDEQVLKDLMRADLKLSGVNLKWVGLTRKEFAEILCDDRWRNRPELMMLQVQAKLKQKNGFAEEKNT